MHKRSRNLRLEDCGDVLTVAEMERVLGIGRNAAYEFADNIGERIGKRILIPRTRLEQFLSARAKRRRA